MKDRIMRTTISDASLITGFLYDLNCYRKLLFFLCLSQSSIVKALNHRHRHFQAVLILTALFGLGCRNEIFDHIRRDKTHSVAETHYQQISYMPHDAAANTNASWETVGAETEAPWSIEHEPPDEYLDLTIEQALQIALQNATILNDLGATILQSPSRVHSRLDPEIMETDPQFGVDAALSQFDARFRSIGEIQDNDRPYNNFFVGGGTQLFRQDYHDYLLELSKKSATGTEFSARNMFDYDANNREQNLFPSAWETQIEMEVRQPLLQGAGVEFNRIAGPNGRPGALQGIVIARLNTDIAITEFEMGLRDFISNVENAYWDLFFAYRLLDTRLDARDQSLKTWKSTIAQIDQKGITAAKEAHAREQYYRFDEDVQNALAGRTRNATKTGNGSQPGTFVGAGGLFVAERRLRLLMGLPIKDQAVIRPISEPKISPVEFEWTSLVNEALAQRPELKKQRQLLKSLDLQRSASKGFTKPRLDAYGRYRFRGLGDHLVGSTSTPTPTLNQGAVEDLFGGQFQEWELGVEMTVPVGFRQGHAAVRNLELQMARARAKLQEQERQIVHDLSNAIAEMQRAQKVSEISYNRLVSAQQRFESLSEELDAPEEILDAQVRLADAKSNYYRSLVEHEAALRNIHYEKGSLLPFRNVILTDHYLDQENTYWESCRSDQTDLARVNSDTVPSKLIGAESPTHKMNEDDLALNPSFEEVSAGSPSEIILPPLEQCDNQLTSEFVKHDPRSIDPSEMSQEAYREILAEHPIQIPTISSPSQSADSNRVAKSVESLPYIDLEQDSPVQLISETAPHHNVNKLPPLPDTDDDWRDAKTVELESVTKPK